jgi:hypothetical protein
MRGQVTGYRLQGTVRIAALAPQSARYSLFPIPYSLITAGGMR